jgi:hypothetical protein
MAGESRSGHQDKITDVPGQYKVRSNHIMVYMKNHPPPPSPPPLAMPKYQCHKEVWALKIIRIDEQADRSAILFPAEDGFVPFRVTPEYMMKHNPQPDGYYVVYEGGYKSFSPAEPFEDGYTKI